MTRSAADVAARDAAASARRAVEAVWRIESARIVATLTRVVGDFSLAEDLAQEALLDALAQWPTQGTPPNPGAWLTAAAKHKAIDLWRRRERLDKRVAAIAAELEEAERLQPIAPPWDPDTIDDDVLRLVFVACHPVLSRESQIALTLRVVGGLSSEEVARAFMVPTATIQARITRAKRTLAAARVPFEVPPRDQHAARLHSVLTVVYLIFNEGYAATSGSNWMRPELAREALRLGRVLAGLLPDEPDLHGLLALMELQASRFGARTTRTGEPILLADQDRTRWDRAQIERGRTELRRCDALGRGRGPYALQAAIAEQHAVAPSTAETDWDAIVVIYEALGRIAPSPVVQLNRAVAVSMATGPAAALPIVDDLIAAGSLTGYALLPSVRGELLAQLGRTGEARGEFQTAARLTNNERERAVLLDKAERI